MTTDPQFGIDDCTCIPFTRQTNPPRILNRPTDTVDMISGWERGRDCPHHTPAPSSLPDQTLRDRIAEAVQHGPTWMLPRSLAEEVADAVLAVLHGLTLRELEQLARPNTPPSRPEPRIPDHTVNEAEAPAPVRQRADCTELEWAQQERARFERLYTRETVRADLAEQRADTAARDADIYQQRLERLGEGYTRERKRADEAEAHRLALSEALGLGTGAPWDAIHDRATELGLPPLAEDPVAQRLGLVPPPADRAALLAEAIRRVEDPAERAKTATGLGLGWEAARDVLRRLAAEAQQPDTETSAEDPARIDRLRPEFTDRASIESIDAQLRRARAQERRWHIRVEWLISLRQARVEQKARGEWSAVPVQPAADDSGEEAGA